MEILEKDKKLSQSLLWNLQKSAYLGSGSDAWSEKGVPLYPTSNTWIAHAYLTVVQGFLRDLAKTGLPEGTIVNLYDLGAGSGRFGFYFLQEWTKIAASVSYRLRYVMTDIVDSNLKFCETHPQLAPYIQQGVLDFAVFDYENPAEAMHLRHSGVKIVRGKDPVVLVANYYFDTIVQDLFHVENGQLLEGLVTLKVPKECKALKSPDLITKLVCEYAYRPAQLYPGKPLWNDLLVQQTSESPWSYFLFPLGALQTLEFFEKFTSGQLLLLASDQAISTKEQMQEWHEPTPAIHYSFSMAVSYYLLKKYFIEKKGSAWVPECANTAFSTLGAVLRLEGMETEIAFHNAIGQFDPYAYTELIKAEEYKVSDLNELIRLICLGRFDPTILYVNYEAIRGWIPKVQKEEKRELLKVITAVAERFYPLSAKDNEFLMNLGVLYFELNAPEMALGLMEQAKERGYVSQLLTNNIAALKAFIAKMHAAYGST